MRCDRAQEFFSDYIERTLERPMAVALEAHLQGCPPCRQDLEFLGEAFESLAATPRVAAPEQGEQNVIWTLRRLHEQQRQAAQGRAPSLLEWLRSLSPARMAIGAALATLVIGGSVMGLNRGPDHTQAGLPFRPKLPAPVAAPQWRVEVQYGEAATGGQQITLRVVPAVAVPDLRIGLDGSTFMTPYEAPAPGVIAAGQPVDVPLTLPHGSNSSAEVVSLTIQSAQLGQNRTYLVMIPLGRRAEGPVTLAMAYQPLESALRQVGPFIGRPVIADAALSGNIKLQVDREQPAQVLRDLATQVGGKLEATDEAYRLTAP